MKLSCKQIVVQNPLFNVPFASVMVLVSTLLNGKEMMGIDSCGMLISAVHHEEGEERLHLLMLDDHIPAGAKMY